MSGRQRETEKYMRALADATAIPPEIRERMDHDRKTAEQSAQPKEQAMRVGFHAKNVTDAAGNPAGGVVVGTGFTISWQDGPLGRGEDRKAPNGAFVEDVIAAVVQRIEHYQSALDGKFKCSQNERAISHLQLALEELDGRTKEREARAVEGTHTP